MPSIISDALISIQQPHRNPSPPRQGAVRHTLTGCGQGIQECIINLEDTPRCIYETQAEKLVPSLL